MITFCLSLPFLFLKFWFIHAPERLVKYFFSLNHSALQFLSLPLMVRTFFKPLKNEYRKGLVGFSIGMGIFIKSLFIVVDVVLMGTLIFAEFVLVTGFILWPFAMFYLFFI